MTNGLRAPRPGVVERARGELLAGAGLAADQHDLGVRRQPLDQAEDLLHHRAAPEHAAELELPRHLALERDDLRAPLELRADVVEHLLQPVEVERLGQVLARAELDRLDRAVDRGVRRSSGSPRSRAPWCGSAAADRGRSRRACAGRPSRGRPACACSVRIASAPLAQVTTSKPTLAARRSTTLQDRDLVVDDEEQRTCGLGCGHGCVCGGTVQETCPRGGRIRAGRIGHRSAHSVRLRSSIVCAQWAL